MSSYAESVVMRANENAWGGEDAVEYSALDLMLNSFAWWGIYPFLLPMDMIQLARIDRPRDQAFKKSDPLPGIESFMKQQIKLITMPIKPAAGGHLIPRLSRIYVDLSKLVPRGVTLLYWDWFRVMYARAYNQFAWSEPQNYDLFLRECKLDDTQRLLSKYLEYDPIGGEQVPGRRGLRTRRIKALQRKIETLRQHVVFHQAFENTAHALRSPSFVGYMATLTTTALNGTYHGLPEYRSNPVGDVDF
jgi:hypothetical protein